MIEITMKQVWDEEPCADGWNQFAEYYDLPTFGEMEDYEATNFEFESVVYKKFPLLDVLESNDLDDALFCTQAVPRHLAWARLSTLFVKEVAHLAPVEIQQTFTKLYRFLSDLYEATPKDQQYPCTDQVKLQIRTFALQCYTEINLHEVFTHAVVDADIKKSAAFKSANLIRTLVRRMTSCGFEYTYGIHADVALIATKFFDRDAARSVEDRCEAAFVDICKDN